MTSPSITSFAEFSERLQKAKRAIAAHLREMPEDVTLVNLSEQLEFADQKTSGGAHLAPEDLSRLNFGMVAARELSDIDAPLAAELASLNTYLDQTP